MWLSGERETQRVSEKTNANINKIHDIHSHTQENPTILRIIHWKWYTISSEWACEKWDFIVRSVCVCDFLAVRRKELIESSFCGIVEPAIRCSRFGQKGTYCLYKIYLYFIVDGCCCCCLHHHYYSYWNISKSWLTGTRLNDIVLVCVCVCCVFGCK